MNFDDPAVQRMLAVGDSSAETRVVDTGGMILLIIVSIIIRALVRKMYQPLNKVVSKMDYVATGSLRTRINVDNMGEDFAKLAIGFNSMMDEIEVLMEQVKLEQHQLEQIRFNALQSQI